MRLQTWSGEEATEEATETTEETTEAVQAEFTDTTADPVAALASGQGARQVVWWRSWQVRTDPLALEATARWICRQVQPRDATTCQRRLLWDNAAQEDMTAWQIAIGEVR